MTIKETKMKIVEDLNQSGLAIDVMELLLENLLNLVHQQSEEAYARAQSAECDDKDADFDEPHTEEKKEQE